MSLQALGYAGFGSAALDDWRQFGTGPVGPVQVMDGKYRLLSGTCPWCDGVSKASS